MDVARNRLGSLRTICALSLPITHAVGVQRPATRASTMRPTVTRSSGRLYVGPLDAMLGNARAGCAPDRGRTCKLNQHPFRGADCRYWYLEVDCCRVGWKRPAARLFLVWCDRYRRCPMRGNGAIACRAAAGPSRSSMVLCQVLRWQLAISPRYGRDRWIVLPPAPRP
jgi:hypothetical protein